MSPRNRDRFLNLCSERPPKSWEECLTSFHFLQVKVALEPFAEECFEAWADPRFGNSGVTQELVDKHKGLIELPSPKTPRRVRGISGAYEYSSTLEVLPFSLKGEGAIAKIDGAVHVF